MAVVNDAINLDELLPGFVKLTRNYAERHGIRHRELWILLQRTAACFRWENEGDSVCDTPEQALKLTATIRAAERIWRQEEDVLRARMTGGD